MAELIIPSFELINDYLSSKGITPEWIKESERHEIKFTGPNGDTCAFSARAENRWKKSENSKPFPVVVFNFRRGNLRTVNTGHVNFPPFFGQKRGPLKVHRSRSLFWLH
jgi:hypothetical protein